MNPRQAEIVDLLARGGAVAVQELAGRFGVSSMTVRRDLDALEHEGAVVRTHGGAMLTRTRTVEFAFAARAERRGPAKRAIAAEVRRSIRPGMSVCLDTGTTTMEVARAIAGLRGIKVLTASLAVSAVLYAQDGIELVMLGGVARKGSPDLYGEITEENVKRFRVNLAVIGADAASAEGIFAADQTMNRVTRAMIAAADEVMLVIDSSKFGGTAFRKYADWDEIDTVVTDDEAPVAVRKWLNRCAGKVRYVQG
ncbi:MAG: DeoR/GlpR family DNA-binding transcription regulator [Planctomycetota bacterium]